MAVRELLLSRRGVAFVSSTGKSSEDHVRAVELELAAIGYVLSTRLRERLAGASLDELAGFRAWAVKTLLEHRGGRVKHEPLFRNFPDDVPTNTWRRWVTRVLVCFMQDEAEPCLFCRQVGTTHVLSCGDVVCDRCWDGANFSACPVCERHVDRASPFFQDPAIRDVPDEHIRRFELIDLATDEREEAKALFLSLCARAQALAPQDRSALVNVIAEYRGEILGWLPAKIPVRENIAWIFATLVSLIPPEDVLPHARRFMTTATDVLRFIAVNSGKDGSLQPTPLPDKPRETGLRFRVAKMARPLRRTLLAILEGLPRDRLVEDMLRHDSQWVWVGEFLHPGEYAKRFPNVAHAFAVVRGEVAAPTWASHVETALRARDPNVVDLLAQRPGDFARRLDHVLRIAPDPDRVLAAMPWDKLATPMLLGLHSHLPRRAEPAAIRVYFPAGTSTLGVSAEDERPVLPQPIIDRAVTAIDQELVRRFATKPRFETAVIDAALRDVVVPFNERTASVAAIALPRGSRVAIAESKLLRMFLHWCEPPHGRETDLDLSVGFYDAAWTPKGVCSYYQLSLGDGIARSAGDLQDAPFPDGASELVDLDRDKARREGFRYAVMVVTAYRGLPFDKLERAFAGLMLRDDPFGHQFDPRTVELKFNLAGDRGVYMPFALDLETNTLHWLDAHAKGGLELNDVANANRSITRICQDLITYFASGTRASMFELALLHAAARCDRVYVRGEATAEFVRHTGESNEAFHARLVCGEADEPRSRLRAEAPVLALLYRGDLALPDGSATYALFRDQVTPTLAASDLLS